MHQIWHALSIKTVDSEYQVFENSFIQNILSYLQLNNILSIIQIWQAAKSSKSYKYFYFYGQQKALFIFFTMMHNMPIHITVLHMNRGLEIEPL